MKVKIISGTYGWRPDKDGSVEPVSKGGTCEVSDAEAARLVGLGVASYVEPPVEPSTKAPAVPPASPPGGEEPPAPSRDTPDEEPPTEPPVSGGEGDPDAAEVARLERMSKGDLEKMAQDMGVHISGARNNHERAVLIAAASTSDDGDAPPNLEAGDIVQ